MYKSAVGIFIVSAIGFLVNLFINVKIPLLLDPNDFGVWRTFILITSFSGILHLGFVDGALLRWIRDENLAKSEFVSQFSSFFYFQVVLCTILIPIALTFSGIRSYMVAIVIQTIINNVMALTQAYFQARRKYVFASLITVFYTIIFLVTTQLFTIQRSINAENIIFIYTASGFFITTAIILNVFWGKYKDLLKFNLKYLLTGIRSGFSILIAGILTTGFFAADKIVIRAFSNSEKFGLYAFASTIVTIIFSFISSIASVLLKFFVSSSEIKTQKFYLGATYIVCIVWIVILSSFSLEVMLIKRYFHRYVAALPYLKALNGTIGTGILVQLFQANLIKASGLQKSFLIGTGVVFSGFVGISSLLIYLIKDIIIIPFVLAAIFLLWFLINEYVILQKNKMYSNFGAKRTISVCFCFLIYTVMMVY